MKGIMLHQRTACFSYAPSTRHPVSLRRSSTGFSIIEMMIALVLIAIGSALALPSYQNMIEKRQLTRGAEQLLAFMNSAQSRSIQWNDTLNVTWTRTGDTAWCVGAKLGNPPCDCTVTDTTSTDYCDINDAPWVFGSEIAGDRILLKSIGGGERWEGGYAFDHERGLVQVLAEDGDGDLIPAGQELAIEMHSKNQNYQLQLVINSTGEARLCSKDADHSIPGYSVCPVEAVEDET